jgi:hypothetical protein
MSSVSLENKAGDLEVGVVRKFVFITTVMAIFSEALVFDVGFDFKIFYCIVFINIFLLLFQIQKNSSIAAFGFDKTYLSVLIYLIASGVFSILLGTNKLPNLLEQVIGITICSFYFYLFFKVFRDISIEKIFSVYADFVFILIIIGYIRYPFDVYDPPRFRSIMTEPAHFTTVILPACYFYLVNKQVFRLMLALGALILSFSSVAFIGVCFGIFISFRLSPIKVLISFVVISLLVYATYNNFYPFKLRVDDTVTALSQSSLKKVNLSTYALMSNYFVAYKSFLSNPLLGRGLGSHILSHSLYIGNIEGLWEDYIDLNAKDANSLMLRVFSDLGLIGFILVMWFLIKNFVRGFSVEGKISKAILIYFFCKLLREGHYFSPEMYFFVFAYYFNYYYYKTNAKGLTV